VAPIVFTVDRTDSSVTAAWLVSMVFFALGWALFGVACWRARVFPTALSIALAVGGSLLSKTMITSVGRNEVKISS
jgi:Domain of unknown function (DUF4386)